MKKKLFLVIISLMCIIFSASAIYADSDNITVSLSDVSFSDGITTINVVFSTPQSETYDSVNVGYDYRIVGETSWGGRSRSCSNAEYINESATFEDSLSFNCSAYPGAQIEFRAKITYEGTTYRSNWVAYTMPGEIVDLSDAFSINIDSTKTSTGTAVQWFKYSVSTDSYVKMDYASDRGSVRIQGPFNEQIDSANAGESMQGYLNAGNFVYIAVVPVSGYDGTLTSILQDHGNKINLQCCIDGSPSASIFIPQADFVFHIDAMSWSDSLDDIIYAIAYDANGKMLDVISFNTEHKNRYQLYNYYDNSDGEIESINVFAVDGTSYVPIADSIGTVQHYTGWYITEYDTYYYINSAQKAYGFYEIEGQTYYFDTDDGWMYRNAFTPDFKYYADENGIIRPVQASDVTEIDNVIFTYDSESYNIEFSCVQGNGYEICCPATVYAKFVDLNKNTLYENTVNVTSNDYAVRRVQSYYQGPIEDIRLGCASFDVDDFTKGSSRGGVLYFTITVGDKTVTKSIIVAHLPQTDENEALHNCEMHGYDQEQLTLFSDEFPGVSYGLSSYAPKAIYITNCTKCGMRMLVYIWE